MAITTLTRYKLFAQISGTDQDTLIQELIPLVEGDIKAICNRTFKDSNGADDFPLGIEMYAVRMISYNINQLTLDANGSFQSETQGGYSYTKDTSGGMYGYPEDIINGLRKWRFISAKESNYLTEYRDQRWLSLKALAKGEALYVEPNSVYDEDLINTI